MKLFSIFKKRTEVVEEVSNNGMERFDGDVIKLDDNFGKYGNMPNL